MAKIEDAAKIYNDLTDKVISLRENIKEKNKTINEKDELLNKAAEKIKSLKNENLKLESSIASNGKAINDNNKIVENLNQRIESLEKELKDQISKQENLNEVIRLKEEEIKSILDEHNRCESSFAKACQMLKESKDLNNSLKKQIEELTKRESFMEEAIVQAVSKQDEEEPEENIKFELHLDMGRKERIYQTIVDATKENIIEPTTELCEKNDVQLSEVYHVCTILTRKLCKGRQVYMTECSDGRTFKLCVPFSVLLTAIRDL